MRKIEQTAELCAECLLSGEAKQENLAHCGLWGRLLCAG